MHKKISNLLKISFIANIFEWYEFSLSAYLALIIGHLFFPSKNDIIAVLISFSIFATSYISRPLGSLFFGHLADKYGTGLSLKNSMILMSMPTTLIGLLPTYYDIGYIATILLLSLKLIHGFSAGGELPINAFYIYKACEENQYRSFLCSLVNVGGMVGFLLASFIIFLLYALFNKETVTEWAWRLPFLLSLPLSIIIFKIRKHIIMGQNLFLNNDKIGLKSSSIKNIIKALVIISTLQVSFYIIFLWLPTYLEVYENIPHFYAKISNVFAISALAILTLFFGYIGKRVNYKTLMTISIISLTMLSYPLFSALHFKSFYILLMVQLMFVLILAPLQGSYIFALGELFGHKNNNLFFAITFTFPTAFFGGTAPLVCSYFIHFFDWPNFPGFYLSLFGLITIPAVIFL